MNTLLLTMLGAVAEFLRAQNLENQREGIAKAKQAGKYKGRKSGRSASSRSSQIRARER
ncbi:recombinase family protein [Deinococcus wulumuqiensis]|uniref:recombinase family protein n=1 Tax=Deinococcus wulumuqiensis TaxID=980427 RepID=UPI00406BCB3F